MLSNERLRALRRELALAQLERNRQAIARVRAASLPPLVPLTPEADPTKQETAPGPTGAASIPTPLAVHGDERSGCCDECA